MIGTPKKEDTLSRYLAEVRSIWTDGTDPDLPYRVKALLEQLLRSTSPFESWIAGLIREGLPAKELYRDPMHGFIQRGHILQKGHRTLPHDHGRCWVLHGVYHGVTEVMIYRRTDDGKIPSRANLEMKETRHLTPGAALLYPPEDIHSIYIPEPSVILSFFSCDSKKVERSHYTNHGQGFRVEHILPPTP